MIFFARHCQETGLGRNGPILAAYALIETVKIFRSVVIPSLTILISGIPAWDPKPELLL